MESKILKLTIKRQWFDLINSGVKIEEYREIKPFYESRLKDGNKYSHVEFYNGGYFSEDLPHSKFKIEKITIGEGREEWGAAPGIQYFIIHLGEKE